MDILEQIQSLFDTYTNNEKKIAQFIIKDPKYFARVDIEILIETIGISKAALIRFSKKIGFNGYIELKYELNRYLLSNNIKSDPNEINSAINHITSRYIEAIENMATDLNSEDINAVAKTLIASNHIKVCGFNKTGASVLHFCKRVLNSGLSVTPCIDDRVQMIDYIDTLTANDALVVFTIEDATKFFSKHLSSIKNTNCKLIVFTFDKTTPIAKTADYLFVLPKLSSRYATFLDLQALFFIAIEIFVAHLAKLQK
ncbi:MAG: MurR/RpiR family transcriptional regulator [Thomasclavelia ramosa]